MATNSFGLDAAYFSDKLSLVLRDLGHVTPEELARALARMARTACEGVLGEAEFTVQAAPTCAAQDGDAQLDAMRRSGLSIDGDNAYKRDLIDCIVGALMLGKQGVNPPPAGHWLEQFWQMARGEGEIQEQIAAAPPATDQPTGTKSDQYRAELYDEVWEEARALGFGNVTEALSALARLKAAEQPDTGHELFAELYQILGELGASEAVLDQVLAASQGEPLPHASLLPYAAGQADTVRVPVEILRRHADHLQTAGYNNAADDLRALLAGGAE